MRLFFLRCKLTWQHSFGATLLLLLSFAAGFFFLNLVVSEGEMVYGYAISGTANNTIVLVDTEHKLRSVELLSYLREKTDYRISEALYLSKVENNHYLIGWAGLNQLSHWIPSGAGRFFTQEEIDSNEEGIIYLCTDLFSHPENVYTDSYEIDGFSYKVIGQTTALYQNVERADTGYYTDFWVNSGSAHFPEIEILPYKAFLKRELPPTLIYLYMPGYTTKQLSRIVEEIKTLFPGIPVLKNPYFDSAQFRLQEILSRLWGTLRYALLVWAMLSSFYSLWLERNKKVNRVLKICGISKAENIFHVLFMLFGMVLLGEGLALLAQAAVWPVLAWMNITKYPPLLYLLFSVILLFAAVSLVNLRSILHMAERARE